ncbi:MAG: formyltetrahydrofolate deformylase [Alphaproteobacteria bacterium]|jgi:formyltetrahydrofolate deformylase|nr:formyltetrahydrofolate deformylase [Alphaproteobacteria bacterium]
MPFILTLSCPNRIGIVAKVSGFLFERGCDITNSAQFDDELTGRFFMRVAFRGRAEDSRNGLTEEFSPIAADFGMDWQLYDEAVKPKVVIMVSKFGHCLNDLLYRYRIGALRAEIPAIVSNHRDFYQLAASHDIPFHHIPVTSANKAGAEGRLREVLADTGADLVVLARYMQVLSTELCRDLSGRAINIHHSFLPSFKGANPYRRAHERGVKLIGATAHFVTADLDEGPIIEQDVARVDHAMTPDDFVSVGRDVECLVLSRAVKWHVERRVIVNGHSTVVFR